MHRKLPLSVVLILSVLSGCHDVRVTVSDTTQYQLYERLPSEHTGIDFENTITESIYFNAVIYDNVMTGGGIGLLDVNNDGLLDIYLAGNMVPDRLYLNKGNMQFEDITDKAGIIREDTWTSGVTIADVNGDGWDDIYLCKHLHDDPAKRVNVYYENQKDGTFRERAKELGIADAGYSIIANFFDYDGDGDLDLYVGNQPPSSMYERPKIKGIIDYRFTDRLYRNDGTRFVEVTEQAGVKNFCYTLAVIVSDLNGDLLPDIYVASDYEEPDYLYINQGDGTFRNVAHEALRHMSNFSMGTDIADFNNDGFPDIYVADMVAEDNYRNKTNMGGMNPEKFWLLANHGFHYQYMFNVLQLNNGNGTFSDIAQLAGVSHTDWSWATFFLDADHDGWRDLFIANGQMKDMRNKDYDIQRAQIINNRDPSDDVHALLFEVSKMAPAQKIRNYFYKNQQDLTFVNTAEAWGFHEETWSQGAVYGDLDNDGDMDIIIHNTNDPVMIYESKVNDLKINNYLIVKAEGPGKNTRGLNAKVTITCGDLVQTGEITAVRGYMSSVQPVAHFGTGSCTRIDQVRVQWPDGAELVLEGVIANQTITAKHSEAARKSSKPILPQTIFEQVSFPEEMTYVESIYDDYAREILLPYQMSTLGPAVAAADVNGDGLDDFYLGGAAGYPGALFLQNTNGTFRNAGIPVFGMDAKYEDGCATFFDADGDGDLDLYVCSGSNEFEAGSAMYQDRLYLNDGKGIFTKSNMLPAITASTGVAVPLDYNNDGTIDLFVGARQVPGQYGRTPVSLLLKNTGGRFEDIAEAILPDGGRLGMVTDAHWIPVFSPSDSYLVVAGEWMPLRVLEWRGDVFEERAVAGLEESEGMWNRIVPFDLDGDGDLDLIAGNCGLNLKYTATPDNPFRLVVNDFDGNGTNDIYLGYVDKFDGKCYPVRGRECSSQQMPFVKAKFASYSEFAQATIDEVLAGRMDGAEELMARNFASGIFENTGNGFVFHPFDNIAQVAPVHGIVVSDFNKDGKADLFMAGNYYNREVETTRSDAGIGNLLLHAGGLKFTSVHPSETGIIANRDVRNVLLLRRASDQMLLIANNNSPLQFYRLAETVQ